MNTSALVHGAPTGIMELDKNDVLLAKEAAIARAIRQYPTYYKSLKAEELSEFTLQGLVATYGGWLGCQHNCIKGRPKKFAAAFCLANWFVCLFFSSIEFSF